MRLHGIVGVHKPAKVRTTIPAEEHPPVPDLIGRWFAPSEPDLAWCGDITYVLTGEGWLYVASVLDLGCRLVGYSMAEHMRTSLVADALRWQPRLVVVRPPGSSSTATVAANTCRATTSSSSPISTCCNPSAAPACAGTTPSPNRSGHHSNAVAHRYRFATRAQARRAIFAWINRYNDHRLHSSLGYLPPVEWEQRYRHTQADQAA